MSQVIKIEPIIDQSKELKKLFEDVNGKLCKLKYAGTQTHFITLMHVSWNSEFSLM